MKNCIFMVTAAALLMTACEKKDTGLTGYAEGDYVYISPTTSGILTRADKRDGDRYADGDSLFEIDATRLKADVTIGEETVRQTSETLADQEKGSRPEEIAVIKRQLESVIATRDNARAEANRMNKLLKSNTVSQSDADEQEAIALVAEARVRELEGRLAVAMLGGRPNALEALRAVVDAGTAQTTKALSYLAEAAPRAKGAGVVERVLYREGEFVPAGSPVMMLLPDGNRKVRFFVSQRDVATIKIGAPVEVMADGFAKPMTAKVSYVSTQAEYTPPVIYSVKNRDKLMFMVEARPDEYSEALRPGLPLTVRMK